MTDTDTIDPEDRPTIRRTVRETITAAKTPPVRSDLVETVATIADCPTDAVDRELDALERNGYLYLVGGDDPEVKLV